jgi:hypothetical protein
MLTRRNVVIEEAEEIKSKNAKRILKREKRKEKGERQR